MCSDYNFTRFRTLSINWRLHYSPILMTRETSCISDLSHRILLWLLQQYIHLNWQNFWETLTHMYLLFWSSTKMDILVPSCGTFQPLFPHLNHDQDWLTSFSDSFSRVQCNYPVYNQEKYQKLLTELRDCCRRYGKKNQFICTATVRVR